MAIDDDNPGYDFFLTDHAQQSVDQLPTKGKHAFALLREELFADPTTANRYVTDASGIPGYVDGDHVMIFGGLTAVYRFASRWTVEVLAVEIRPLLR